MIYSISNPIPLVFWFLFCKNNANREQKQIIQIIFIPAFEPPLGCAHGGSFSASLYALAKVQLAPVLVLLRFPHMKRAVHHCVLFPKVVEVDCLYFCLFFVCHRLNTFLIRLQNYINFRHHQGSQSKMHSCRAVMGGLRRSEGTSEGLKYDVSHHD